VFQSANHGKGGPSVTNDWGRYGHGPVRLLTMVALIDAIDRGILPGVLTKVQDDLGFSDTQAGVLGSVFVFTTFLVALPAGYIVDRYNRGRIIALVLASWGAISGLNAVVQSYWQFLGVRGMLGVAEAVNHPGSNSLIADFYPPAVRTRAYSFLRAAPIAGAAIGTGLGGLVGEVFGWRWAFLLVGVPGSLLAFRMLRMPEPRRGESDGAHMAELPRGVRALLRDVRIATSIPTLRSLMVGLAMATGALVGIGFWAPAFYERHAGLSSKQAAGLTGGLILIGALFGTLVGGRVADRMRGRYEGAPMLYAGVSLFVGTAIILPTFLPVPLWVRIPLSVPAVALIVSGLPALAAMIAEVVSPAMRGIAFSITTFFTAIAGAVSPLLIGFISDRFPITVNGVEKGHLGNAFVCVLPIVMVGAIVVLRGRRHVVADTARALEDLQPVS
jgi:MFS family permease